MLEVLGTLSHCSSNAIDQDLSGSISHSDIFWSSALWLYTFTLLWLTLAEQSFSSEEMVPSKFASYLHCVVSSWSVDNLTHFEAEAQEIIKKKSTLKRFSNIFSRKRFFLYFGKLNFLAPRSKKFLYFSKRFFLIFREGTCKALSGWLLIKVSNKNFRYTLGYLLIKG